MPDCGAEHGKICEAMEHHESEIKEVWGILRGKLATQVFVWSAAVVGVALSLIIGWLGASNGKLQEVYTKQQVVVERVGNVQQLVERNREVVTEQYNSVKESIRELKQVIRKADD